MSKKKTPTAKLHFAPPVPKGFVFPDDLDKELSSEINFVDPEPETYDSVGYQRIEFDEYPLYKKAP